MKTINKNQLFINFCSIVCFCIILFINNCFINNLTHAIILNIFAFFTFLLFCVLRLKGLKNCIYSVEFIYGIVFWIYSIIGPIIFSLDNYSPRYYYFQINSSYMFKTLVLYINIFMIYGIICFAFNKIKNRNIDKKILNLEEKTAILNNKVNLLDFVNIFASLSVLYKLLSYGSAFFSLQTLVKRDILNSGISHYLNLFMVVYSLFIALAFFSKNKKNTLFKFRFFITLLYWFVYVTCERRMFVSFLIGLILIAFAKLKKIKLKHIICVFMVMAFFLLIAAYREGILNKDRKINDILYSSTTEYYCTFSISESYIVKPPELKYGKTYVFDTLTKLVPRYFYPNKPEDLSQTFKKENNLNVGFAYNPVAEGILNFGKSAFIFVPLIIFMITIICNYLSKKNVLYFLIICVNSLDFFRGAFSNYFFDVLFCIIIAFIIYGVKIKKCLK